jgi:hypothetical protein
LCKKSEDISRFCKDQISTIVKENTPFILCLEHMSDPLETEQSTLNQIGKAAETLQTTLEQTHSIIQTKVSSSELSYFLLL